MAVFDEIDLYPYQLAMYRELVSAQGYRSTDSISKLPNIKNVIFNDPATIVYWGDGTKTVVKAQNETFDPEKGLAMAISKKALGNKGNYYNTIKKWTEKYSAAQTFLAEAIKSINSMVDKINSIGRRPFGF